MTACSYWLQSSLRRVYPTSPAEDTHTLDLPAARGERLSFQACARNETPAAVTVQAAVSAPDPLRVTVRRVGYVPMPHLNTDTPRNEQEGVGQIPGLVPDPLFPEETIILGPHETAAFWVTLRVPEDAAPGAHEITVRLTAGEEQAEQTLRLDVRPVTLAWPAFPVTHWFYADALCDWYSVEPYEERFWEIVRPYMRNLVEHGGSCQYVPLFTPPTDGVKRPHQLLKVTDPAPGRYEFDFADVRRWVRTAWECGARYFEWTHLFTQWGVQHALRIYRSNQRPNSLLWPPETGAESETYRLFLAQFLPAFHLFLRDEGLLGCSFFHVSDEPGTEHLPNYRAAREMLRELAPWMKISDALSEVEFGREGLTDIPIPVLSSARDFAEAGISAWTYFCCGPRGHYLNRLMDTPLAKIRMAGWLFHRFQAQGFLHWGYNYWYRSQTQQMIDPFVEQAAGVWPGLPYGDPFVVYPGPDGPLDSIRWEVWADSLQDHALLHTLGVEPDDPRLADLRGYDDFPKTEDWIHAARRLLLAAG